MKNKILYLLSVALFLSLQIAEGQQNAKPLKITSCKVVEMEVEVDLIKPTIITIVNNLQATSRKYKIVEGNGLITKIGKFDVVEYKDNKPVKIQVIVEDKKLGCDTAYVTCRAGNQTVNVSSKFYLDQKEWNATTNKFAKAISKRPAMAYVENNTKLPNVLIIGTSISIGYTPFVREILSAEANVYRIPENSNSTATSLAKIDFWMGDMKWDVIHVNWGLHDLKYTFGDKEQDVPPAQYKSNLRKLFKRMEQTGAKIIWANTSYYPDKCTPRRDVGDDMLYNNIALEVLKEFPNIIIDDQYSLTKANPQNQQPHNVHFTPEGYKQQANQAALVIRKALK